MGFIRSNLRVLMAERGFNIQNVKDKTTLSRTTISNLYNNYGSGVQYDTLRQLCELLKCQPGDLLTFVDVSVSFENLTRNPGLHFEIDTHLTDPSEGEGFDYISRIQTELEIQSTIVYSGVETVINTTVDVDFSFTEDKTASDNTVLGVVQSKLEPFKFPHYIEEHILDNLKDFISEIAHDFFDEISRQEL